MELDISGCQGATYDITAVVTDRNGDINTYKREAMSVSSENGNVITYALGISADDVAYGRLNVSVTTRVVNSPTIIDAYYNTAMIFMFESLTKVKRKNQEF